MAKQPFETKERFVARILEKHGFGKEGIGAKPEKKPVLPEWEDVIEKLKAEARARK